MILNSKMIVLVEPVIPTSRVAQLKLDRGREYVPALSGVVGQSSTAESQEKYGRPGSRRRKRQSRFPLA